MLKKFIRPPTLKNKKTQISWHYCYVCFTIMLEHHSVGKHLTLGVGLIHQLNGLLLESTFKFTAEMMKWSGNKVQLSVLLFLLIFNNIFITLELKSLLVLVQVMS